MFGPGRLVLEVVHHRGQGDRSRAQAMLRFAAEHGVPVVLSNAVRYVDALDAPTADVLDAARRLVPLDARHVDRRTAEGYLKSGKEMAEVAEDLVGPDRDAALRLLERTARLAEQCAVDIRDGPRHRQRPLSRARRGHHAGRAGDGPLGGAAGPLRGRPRPAGDDAHRSGCGSGWTRSWR